MSDIAAQIRDLAALLKDGLLTREEFQEQKSHLLRTSRETASAKAAAAPAPNKQETPSGPISAKIRAFKPARTPKGKRLGSYSIIGELGRGGMGIVYRARHLIESMARRQGGDVAIKVMGPELAADRGFRTWFEREATLGLKLRHPSVVKVFEVLLDGETLGLVMSLIEGESLRKLIPQGGMPLDRALAILRPLAEALDHIHDRGVIHRDLKPENISINRQGRPVLLDFGIAKDTGGFVTSITSTAAGMGTIVYMAPEQYLDTKRVGSACDRYALGMLAYELLSGSLPWPRDTSEYQVMRAKESGDLPPLSATMPSIDGRVSKAVSRMLAVKTWDRFKTAKSFVDALGPAGAPVSSHASGPTRYHHHGPWGRRRGIPKEVAQWIASAPGERHLLWRSGWPNWKSWREVPEIASLVEEQLPRTAPVEVREVGDLSFKMLRVEPGSFDMGSPEDDEHAFADEHPVHKVTLTRPFQLAELPITQELFEAITRTQARKFSVLEPRCPAEMISWYDAIRFCNQLSELFDLEPAYILEGEEVRWEQRNDGFRLPTEAEWEFAARGKGTTPFSGSSDLRNVGWYAGNSTWRAHPVGQKAANALGFFDMSGNVWEWVWDRFGPYTPTEQIDPIGPDGGYERVKRGGSWWNLSLYARVALRVRGDPLYRYGPLGFRLARNAQ